MERPIVKPVGTPVEELDTPALVVDLDILEQNIETVHSFFRQQTAKVRPNVDAHRCPAIAHKQLAVEGTVGGISVANLGEAEVFAQGGFSDIFIANQIVTPQKINRLCALAHQAKITVAVDNPQNVKDISEAAQSSGVIINAVVQINTRLNHCGVEPGQPAVDLAKTISQSQGLHFAGLTSDEGTIITENTDEIATESKKYAQVVLDTRQMVEAAGLDVETVSVGSTQNYEIIGAMSGVTEVPAGTYALMDYKYRQSRPQLTPAARVMATVTSRPEPGTAILDSGRKAMGEDLGFPAAEALQNVTVAGLSAEHGKLQWKQESMEGQISIGNKVWLTPWDIGACVNVYDFIRAVRNGKLEAVLDISARGRYR